MIPRLFLVALIGGDSQAVSPRDTEFWKLMPHVTAACEVVQKNPRIFPDRASTFGPFGLETRKASGPQEADAFRNFYLGVVGAACGLTTAEQLTGHFFCGPECPRNRRERFVRQTKDIRAIAAAFEKVSALRLIAVWAPEGELRVNDVFVMSGQVREAIPSPIMGFVPSGEWKAWPSLATHLETIGVAPGAVRALAQRMRAMGLSALLREPSGIRLIGEGVGDNESGIVLIRSTAPAPEVGRSLSDNKTYAIVERLAADVYYYETK